jgi:hypothetical protein
MYACCKHCLLLLLLLLQASVLKDPSCISAARLAEIDGEHC